MNKAVIRNMKQITIGLDLGDRRHTYCVLDEAGKMAREGSLGNTRETNRDRWHEVPVPLR